MQKQTQLTLISLTDDQSPICVLLHFITADKYLLTPALLEKNKILLSFILNKRCKLDHKS